MTASGDLDRRYGGGDSQKSEIHGFGNCLTGQNYENSGISRALLNFSAVTQVAFVPFSSRMTDVPAVFAFSAFAVGKRVRYW